MSSVAVGKRHARQSGIAVARIAGNIMPLTPGTKLGHFEILAAIGDGGRVEGWRGCVSLRE
jgi:hypothetical protein